MYYVLGILMLVSALLNIVLYQISNKKKITLVVIVLSLILVVLDVIAIVCNW